VRPDDFYSRLKSLSRRLAWKRFAALVCAWLVFLSSILLGLAAVESVLVFREGFAFAAAAGAVAIALVVFPVLHELLRRRHPLTPSHLAARIEQRHPEFLDTLKCAVDVAEGRIEHSGSLVPLLVIDVQQRTLDIDFAREIRPFWARPSVLVPAAAIALLAAVAADQTRFADKAWNGFHAAIGLGSPGIVVEPADLRVARGRNLELNIGVLRWEPSADVVFRTGESPEWQRFPAVSSAERAASFTFYAVTEPIEFRVETPSLRSPLMRVEPFTPPRIDSARIIVTPPRYTALPEFTLDALADLEVVEGSSVTFELESGAESVALRTGSGSTELTRSPGGGFTHTLTATESTDYRFSLRTADNLSASTPTHALTVIPDQPPLVEIWNPGEDVAAEPSDSVPIEVYSSDDYGLGEAHLYVSVSGENKRIISLSVQATGEINDIGTILEAQATTLLSLSDLGAEDGDVIAYYAVVADNRDPNPHASRSPIFFIEARAEKPPIKMPGGVPLEQEGIELRAFIIELKRLIRLSYEAAEASDAQRAQRNTAVTADLGVLHNELSGLRETVAPELQDTPLQPLLDWLDEALIHLQQSELLINRNFTEEAIGFEERALANLVRIENALRLNIISEQASSGGEGQSESQEQQAQQSESQSGSESESAGDPANLEALRKQIEQLVARQNRLNAELERAPRADPDEAAMAELASRQEQLRADTLNLAREIARVPDSENVRLELREARNRMSAGAAAANDANPEAAWVEGMRAREALLAAAAELEQLTANALAAALEQLQQAAADMAQRQGQLAGESESAASSGGGASPGLYDQQGALQSELEALLGMMQSASGALADSAPQLGQAMSDAVAQSDRAGTGRAMTRAGNALLYERYDRAGQLQREAQRGLEQLAEDIGAMKSALPPPGAAQLEALMAALERDRQRVGDAAGESDADQTTRENLRDKWSERLDNLSQSLDDPQMGDIAGSMARIGASGAASAAALDRLLAEAGEALLRQWSQAIRRERLNLNRESAPPPDAFRSQVEEYFKSLAEEP